MSAWGLIWLLIWPVLGRDPVREEYLELVQEKERLVYENRKLNLEDKAVQAKTPYLVVDLGSGQITAKRGGVVLRNAPINWSFRSSGRRAVFADFQIEERIEVIAPRDTNRADSGFFRRLWGESAVVYRLRVRGGPELWIANLPPMEGRLDTLVLKTGIWLRNLPGMIEHQRIQVFVAVEEMGWIRGVTEDGNWVVVIPPGPEDKGKGREDAALAGETSTAIISTPNWSGHLRKMTGLGR